MGAPKGNNFAGNALIAKKALEHSLLKYQNEEPQGEKASKFNALVDIWDAQIAKAVDGDNYSATMIIDRLDGKPKQQTEISGDLTVENYDLTETERSARITALLDQARSRRDEQVDNEGCASMDPAGGATV